MNDGTLGAIVLAVSVALHGGTYLALGGVGTVEEMERELASLDIEVIEPPPPPEPEPEPAVQEPEPEPEVEEPPPPPPEPVRRERVPPPEEQPPEPPPPAEETPVAFDNIVLTNEGTSGSGWSVQQGSGREATGPIGPPGQVTGRRVRGQANGTVGGTGEPTAPPGPPVVAIADLSRRPVPPSGLNALLEQNYPRTLRQQGVEGEAVVRIRVNPNGSLSVLGVQSETQAGFGEACMRTLRAAEAWSPPLDRDGRPVATVTRFTCEFTVRY